MTVGEMLSPGGRCHAQGVAGHGRTSIMEEEDAWRAFPDPGDSVSCETNLDRVAILAGRDRRRPSVPQLEPCDACLPNARRGFHPE
jgi:hypothetical protein